MLNWTAQNRTVLSSKLCTLLNWIIWIELFWHELHTYANWIVWIRTVWLDWIAWNKWFWQLNCVLMLNWIVWNRTVYLYKNGFGIK